jgi:DNA-binding response OmpR family regulator
MTATQRARPLVLIVEDDQALRRMYADVLTHAGFDVIDAHNGLQAAEKARDFQPDIVITDLALPGIDGYELCRRMRRDPAVSHVPVVAITGRYLAETDRARAHSLGCSAVLIKPVADEALVGELRRVLAET